jgi:hypothetical protein
MGNRSGKLKATKAKQRQLNGNCHQKVIKRERVAIGIDELYTDRSRVQRFC